MEFLNLSIFGALFVLALVFITFMHKFKEDEGSSIAYGFFSTGLLTLLAGIIFFGFKPIELISVSTPFDINMMLGIICLVLGLYSAWYSVELYKYKKRQKKDIEEKQNFIPE